MLKSFGAKTKRTGSTTKWYWQLRYAHNPAAKNDFYLAEFSRQKGHEKGFENSCTVYLDCASHCHIQEKKLVGAHTSTRTLLFIGLLGF